MNLTGSRESEIVPSDRHRTSNELHVLFDSPTATGAGPSFAYLVEMQTSVLPVYKADHIARSALTPR